MTDNRAGLTGVLVAMGIGWGLSWPLAKIAVSTGHGAFGLIFWQLLISILLLGAIHLRRGGGWPITRASLPVHITVALFGTILPDAITYPAAFHLPAGILSIIVAATPMLSFPIALALGADRLVPRRMLGLVLGLVGVGLIVLPEAGVSGPVLWLLLALLAPLSYAIEGNFVDTYGTNGMDAIQVLLGASIIGLVAVTPLALATGQFIVPPLPLGPPEWALIGAATIHAIVYTAYVWLVGRSGAVFASQVSYIVTLSGVLWSMAILGERYAGLVWLAMILMVGGIFLVAPRPPKPLDRART
jgi:drug/metabolite transporter (DMT)-like permease